MKKLYKLMLFGIACLFFCACNYENKGSSGEKESDTYLNSPTPTKPMKKIEENVLNIETMDWTELDCYVDEETSRQNSNFLNYGFLTYDEEGNIYYIDLNYNVIYVSDYKGENKRLISENSDAFGWLRLDGDWLYYCTQETAIMRVHIETGETEQICEEYSGHFRIDEEKLYWEDRENGGFSLADTFGRNKELVADTSAFYVGFFQKGNDFWLMEGDSKATQNQEHYIIKAEEKKTVVLNQKGYYPLLAGVYLSVVDEEVNERHIWNLETKEKFDLEARIDQTMVSDGKNFYYKQIMYGDAYAKDGDSLPKEQNAFIFQWDGGEPELIWQIDTDNLYYMFLTPKALYCLPQMKAEGYKYSLLYYDLETGETGKIY